MPTWTYLPQTKSYRFKPVSRYHDFGNLEIRRIKRRDYWSLFYTMWFFLFITFTMKMGQISAFALGGRKPYSGLKVMLPEIRNTIYLIHHNNYLKIWIDRFGNIVINDNTIKNNYQLFNVLQEFNNNHAPAPVLYIDVEVKMEIVNEVILNIKKSGYKEIIFASNLY
jgi:biopolymer transport protein ExbD